MNKGNNRFTNFFIGIITCTLLIVPMMSHAQMGGTPTFQLLGVSAIDKTSATAVISFDSLDSEQSIFSNSAKIFAQYTNVITGGVAITAFVNTSTGDQTYNFRMSDLEPATPYSVMGVMIYKGIVYQTQPKTFTTVSNQPESQVSIGQPSTSSPTTPSSTVSGSFFGSFFSGIKQRVMTGGATTENGVTLAITNEQARVDVHDTFTYTIRYFNERTTSLQNAKIFIDLPPNYEFVRSTTADLEYNTKTNSVSIVIGRIGAGANKAFTFTARALDASKNETATTATLFYEGGKIAATDHDSFYGSSSNGGNNSVLGVGFFPRTLLGWIVIILFITFIIIALRRYVTKPVKHKTHEHEHEEKHHHK